MERRFGIQPPKEQDGPASAEIRELVKADQADRQFKTPPPKAEWEKIATRDKQRRERMREILLSDKLVTGDDFGGAFLLFQHGEKPDDYLTAHDCAIIAQLLLRNLSNNAAIAEDRFLNSVRRNQRFGSQFDWNNKARTISSGKETDVTDGLRMDYFCPSQEASLKGALVPDGAAVDRTIERVKKQVDPEWQKRMEDSPDGKRLRELGMKTIIAFSGDNRTLKEMREPPPISKEIREKIRRGVLELYRADRLHTPSQYSRAGSILHWSWRKGDDPDILLLAHELAVVGMMRWHPDAGQVAAMTWDEYLVTIGQPQRYGTIIRKVIGKDRIEPPVSPTVTDTIRAKFHVTPLQEAIENARPWVGE